MRSVSTRKLAPPHHGGVEALGRRCRVEAGDGEGFVGQAVGLDDLGMARGAGFVAYGGRLDGRGGVLGSRPASDEHEAEQQHATAPFPSAMGPRVDHSIGKDALMPVVIVDEPGRDGAMIVDFLSGKASNVAEATTTNGLVVASAVRRPHSMTPRLLPD